MRRTFAILALGWLLGPTACASHTKLAPKVRAALQKRYEGEAVALTQSCYYGDLYDDNEKWLLSPHPFADIHHIVTPAGEPIHPTGERGIVPAGTRFLIRKLEFPDAAAMPRRMLTTPRYNPWVYLAPLENIQGVADFERAFILLLPMDLPDRAAVEAELDKLLAPASAVQGWLRSRRAVVRLAIEGKRVVVGMSEAELVAARGRPARWLAEPAEGARVAWYPSTEVWMQEGHVVEVRDGRPLALVFSKAGRKDHRSPDRKRLSK